MNSKKGNSLLETRRRNRVLIKDTIFRLAPVTRTTIAEQLELTLPTITTSVNEMLNEGILEEVSLPEGAVTNTIGRKPSAIAFKAEAALSIGVELGPYATRVVLLNIAGEVIKSSVEDPAAAEYQIMLIQLSAQIRAIMHEADLNNLLGICIGLPGFIECEKGIIRSNFREDWVGKHLAEDLNKSIGIPVLIDNNVRLRAIGYEMGSSGRKPDIFAYFYISKGIACPLMVRDDVLSGYTAGAGEIGHTVIWVEGSGCTVKKCLDDLAAEKAIFEECQRIMNLGGARRLKEIMMEKPELTMKHILRAQAEGDEDICAILAKSIEHLGIALSNVVNLINPGFVVVDGYIMTNEENQKLLVNAAKSNFFGLNEEEVNIVFLPFDHFCGARGAAYFAIRRLFLEK